jgi:hypothetical protein
MIKLSKLLTENEINSISKQYKYLLDKEVRYLSIAELNSIGLFIIKTEYNETTNMFIHNPTYQYICSLAINILFKRAQIKNLPIFE